MASPGHRAFSLLVAAQAAHSLEEYHFRLWEVFYPARLVAESIGSDPALTFAVLNIVLVSAMLASALVFLARNYLLPALAWFWIALELVNGVTHLTVAFVQGTYFPGAYTAPFLILFAIVSAYYVRTNPGSPARATLNKTPNK